MTNEQTQELVTLLVGAYSCLGPIGRDDVSSWQFMLRRHEYAHARRAVVDWIMTRKEPPFGMRLEATLRSWS